MAPTALAHLGQAGKVLILVLLELQKKGEGQGGPPRSEGGQGPQPLLPEEDHFQRHLGLLSGRKVAKDPATAIPRLKLGSEIPDQRLWNKQPRLQAGQTENKVTQPKQVTTWARLERGAAGAMVGGSGQWVVGSEAEPQGSVY